jgi:hypothetical protein
MGSDVTQAKTPKSSTNNDHSVAAAVANAVDEAEARAWFSEFGPSDVGFTEMRDVVMAALRAQQLDDRSEG